MKSSDGGKPTDVTSPQETELKVLLGQFTLSFLKAMMMTGIYPPDHPAIADVVGEPHRLLVRLAPHSNEITYMSASAAIGDEVVVEGVLTEGVPFKTLMHSSMGEVFARKFLAYFERNQLVSFSIKTRMEQEEFRRFISMFAERRTEEEERGAVEAPFGELLLSRGIVHVTVMVRQEVVGGERPLPWRVKMAISRLRKDLTLVPLYSRATAKELAEAKTMLVQDITRPLRRPQFLKELLANADLITVGVPSLETVDIEKEIVWCQHEGMLENISWDIVGDLERASWGAIKQRFGDVERRLDEILKNILKNIAVRLREVDPGRVHELLNHLFKRKILKYHDLPHQLQQELLVEKWTVQFLANSQSVMSRFEKLSDAKLYYEYINTFQQIFPELLVREELAECARMAAAVRSHLEAPPGAIPDRRAHARVTINRFTEPHVLDRLVRLVDRPDKEPRAFALQCLTSLGDRCCGPLLKVLTTSTNAQVRRDVARTIESLGDDALVPVMEMLTRKGAEWYVYRNMIMMLANLGGTIAVDDIRRYISHPHPRVREECVRTLQMLLGAEAEVDLIPLVRDNDPAVARKGIAALGRMGCKSGPFVDSLAGLVRERTEKEEPVPEDLQLAALDAISRLGAFESGGHDIRDILAAKLKSERSFLGKFLKRSKSHHGERLRAAVCSTLGMIGDQTSARALEKCLEDGSQAVRQRAAEAIKRISKRHRK